MTSQADPPVGLFIKLPISLEDIMTVRRHIMSASLTNDGIVKGLEAIAIPVRGDQALPFTGDTCRDHDSAEGTSTDVDATVSMVDAPPRDSDLKD